MGYWVKEEIGGLVGKFVGMVWARQLSINKERASKHKLEKLGRGSPSLKREQGG